MTDQADSRFAHLPPPPAPPHWWEVPPTSPPLTGAPLPPLPTRRRVEVGVRNLVLGLGVLSLVAAAVSFVAMHWEILDASLRAVVVVGATVPILLGTVEARRRRLSGTATALSWLLMVWMFVGLWAVLRAIDFTWSASASWAVGGAVLFVMFVGLQRVHTDAAMKTGAILAWLTGWLSAFDVWNVRGPDVWVLPIAAVVGWL